MKTETNEYTQQVSNWLTAHGIKFVITRIGSELGFGDEKDPKMMHDTYHAVFTREVPKPARFEVPKFYQSADRSESEIARQLCKCNRTMAHARKCPANRTNAEIPSAYTVLMCVTKSDPGTFAEFCSNYGCDEDSRAAERVYFEVQSEWERARKFFTLEELGELEEITC